ncbi:MAG: response regulator transcription factor [Dehalococcoidia bacterium]|nr:response regulator transcription factor [Dehalococcoidia bacterium]
MAGEKILVVDDEARIVELVQVYLERDGFLVLAARDGIEALEVARRERPDLVILDLMLPGMGGLEVCRVLRSESSVPIIMLTARDEEVDKLIGLELGADDYITKPFSPREVVARVRAVLRRAASVAAHERRLVAGNLIVDSERHEVFCHGNTVMVTPTEFKLLEAFARSPGRVYSRLQLLEMAQGEAYEGYERTIDAHIKNLRDKLSAFRREAGCGIVTVYGVGYKLEVQEDA